MAQPEQTSGDRESLARLQGQRLQAMLAEILPRNAFYAERFARANLKPDTIRTPADLARLPFVTKKDLLADQAENPPYGRVLTYPVECYSRMHQTSGTAGTPLRWLDTPESWEWCLDCWRQMYEIIGLCRDDRLLFPFSFGPFLGFWTAFEAATRRGNLCLPAGGMSSAARLRHVLDHSVTVVLCTPTYAGRLAEVAREEGLDLANSSVRALIVAGEPGGSVPAIRDRIETAWGARVYDHSGMTEAGPLAVECNGQRGGLHLLETECIAEVIDPGTGLPLPDGEVGELVLTNLGRWGSPLLRYRTGDLVCFDPAPCPCGYAGRRLKDGILGRTDDMIHLRGNNVYPSAFEALIRQVPEVAEYRIAVDQSGPLPSLNVEVEPVAAATAAHVVERVDRAIRDALLFRARVTAVAPGSLPRFEMKARRVLVQPKERPTLRPTRGLPSSLRGPLRAATRTLRLHSYYARIAIWESFAREGFASLAGRLVLTRMTSMNRTLPLLTALCCLTAVEARAANWSNWRGPEQNGVSREKDLPDTWSPKKDAPSSNLVWSVPYGGITTPIIQNGRVYIINKVGSGVGQQERVMCFNEADGKLLNEYKFNVWLTGIVRDRLGFTNLAGDAETGNVYAHTTSGMFFCFDKDLKILWSHSLTEEYGRVSGYGGRLASPLVDGDLVILSMLNASWGEMAIGGNRFAAFDKKTGDVVWWASTGVRVSDTYSSSPVVAVINGERLLISGGFGGVYAFRVRTGEKVWAFPLCNGAVNCDPVVDGNFVYIGHGEENKFNGTEGSVVCLDASVVKDGKPKLVWRQDGIKAKFASPIIHDGRLYICNEAAVLFCLDAKTGEEKWNREYGDNTKGSPVWADGKIYVGEVDGKFHILKPKDDACEDLHVQAFPAYDGVPTEVNGSPAIVNGRIYFLTTHDFYCIGKKDHSAKADPIPPRAKEDASAKDAKATHLQIVPADVLLTPGASQTFKVFAFDAHGRSLGAIKADWTLGPMKPPVFPPGIAAPPPPAPGTAGPPDLKGKLDPENGESTKLTVLPAPPLQFGEVIAKVGDLKAEARVRVTPKLPFIADFSKVPEGRTPAGWVNTQGKFSMVKFEDKPVLKKRNDNPNILVARTEAFIAAPNLADYTIESDVYGTKVKSDLPDVGVGNCRYQLELVGNDQILKLHTWDAQTRLVKDVKFPWKPETWYTLKLKVSQAGGKALVQGKTWPRGEKEPPNWTIEYEDPYPNTEGAPFLYGFSTGIVDAKNPGCVIYYDNVKITPNK